MRRNNVANDPRMRTIRKPSTVERKAHTVKTLILATSDKYIHFVSKGWVGKTHDYTQLKGEFSPDLPWLSDLPVGLDLGYQGFAKDYAMLISALCSQ